jgi:NAD(P)H-hydrate repair Nnr-like enzyme with NAD(P)H-hydrate dehydratase domain
LIVAVPVLRLVEAVKGDEGDVAAVGGVGRFAGADDRAACPAGLDAEE